MKLAWWIGLFLGAWIYFVGAPAFASASVLQASDEAEQALKQAREAIDQGALDRAELLLERVLMLVPEQAEARVLLASLMAQVGRVDTALLLLQSLIDDPRTESDYRTRLKGIYALMLQAPRLAALARVGRAKGEDVNPKPYWRSELSLSRSSNPLARTSATELALSLADSVVSLPLEQRPGYGSVLGASVARLGSAYGFEAGAQQLYGGTPQPVAARVSAWGPLPDDMLRRASLPGLFYWQLLGQQSFDDQRRYSAVMGWAHAQSRWSLAHVEEPSRDERSYWLRFEQRGMPIGGGYWTAQIERSLGGTKTPDYWRLGVQGEYGLGAQRFATVQWGWQSDLTGYSPLLEQGERRWLESRSVAIEQHVTYSAQNIVVFRVVASERRSNLAIFSFRDVGFQVSFVSSWL